jgi:hypothetical protein
MHPEPEEFALYLKGQLSPDVIPALEQHLAACEACVQALCEQDRYLWCLAEISADELTLDGEKRRYPRITTDEPAVIQSLAPFATDVWDIRIIDVSKGGVRIHTPRPLEPESLIRVSMKFSIACGDVRHCTSTVDGYHAGIRLHDYFLANTARSF